MISRRSETASSGDRSRTLRLGVTEEDPVDMSSCDCLVGEGCHVEVAGGRKAADGEEDTARNRATSGTFAMANCYDFDFVWICGFGILFGAYFMIQCSTLFYVYTERFCSGPQTNNERFSSIP